MFTFLNRLSNLRHRLSYINLRQHLKPSNLAQLPSRIYHNQIRPFLIHSFHNPRSLTPLLTWPLFASATIIFLNDNIFEITGIKGKSMTPTLSPNYHETGQQDSFLWRKFGASKNLQRGDLVYFLAPHKKDRIVVKRVVATEGDEVFLDPRRCNADEGPVGDKMRREWELMGHWNWLGVQPLEGLEARGPPKVKVPFGHVWVEGDNWRESLDSNAYGPVSMSLIQGKAIALVWPWSRRGVEWRKIVSRTIVKEGDVVVPKEVEDLL